MQIENFGGNISGGQRQRLMLARVLGRKASVYLFDEATNALNSKCEVDVLTSIAERIKGKTSLVFSSRTNNAKTCDKVFVLNNGRIIEQGVPSKLLSRKGKFWALCET